MKTQVQLHNEFLIVTEDVVTKERKKYKTQNVVLTHLYHKLAASDGAANNHTSYIAVGDGHGIPSAADSTLFNNISMKLGTIDASGKATIADLSYFKRLVTFYDTQELVGKTITEVGLSNNAVAVTHAMLKDSVGNVIGISKTDTMKLYIYATVYASIVTPPIAGVKYFESENNRLLRSLIGLGQCTGQIGTNVIPAAAYQASTSFQSAVSSFQKAAGRTVVGPQSTWSTRLQTAESNEVPIRSIVIDGVGAIDFVDTAGPVAIQNVVIPAEADNLTYLLQKHEPMEGSIVVKVNGIIADPSTYDLLNTYAKISPYVFNDPILEFKSLNLGTSVTYYEGSYYRFAPPSTVYKMTDGVVTTIPLKGITYHSAVTSGCFSADMTRLAIMRNDGTTYYAWNVATYALDLVTGIATVLQDEAGFNTPTYGSATLLQVSKFPGYVGAATIDGHGDDDKGGIYKYPSTTLAGPVPELCDKLNHAENFYYGDSNTQHYVKLSDTGIEAMYDKHHITDRIKLRIEPTGKLFIDYYDASAVVIDTIEIMKTISVTAAVNAACYTKCYAQQVGSRYMRLIYPTGTAIDDNVSIVFLYIDFVAKKAYPTRQERRATSRISRRHLGGHIRTEGDVDYIATGQLGAAYAYSYGSLAPAVGGIKMHTPLGASDVLTLSYTLDYIPKTADWVVDYSHTITFGA